MRRKSTSTSLAEPNFRQEQPSDLLPYIFGSFSSASPMKRDNMSTRDKAFVFRPFRWDFFDPSMAQFSIYDCIKSRTSQHGLSIFLTACLPFAGLRTLKLRGMCVFSVQQISQNPLRIQKSPDLMILLVCRRTVELFVREGPFYL